MTDQDGVQQDSARQEIIDVAVANPWFTQSEIADEVGTARSWVSQVLDERPEVDELRSTFRYGVDLDGDADVLEALAVTLERTGTPADELAARVLVDQPEAIESVRLEFEISDGVEGDNGE